VLHRTEERVSCGTRRALRKGNCRPERPPVQSTGVHPCVAGKSGRGLKGRPRCSQSRRPQSQTYRSSKTPAFQIRGDDRLPAFRGKDDTGVFAMERLRHISGKRICGRPFRPRGVSPKRRAEALRFARAGFQPGGNAVGRSFGTVVHSSWTTFNHTQNALRSAISLDGPRPPHLQDIIST